MLASMSASSHPAAQKYSAHLNPSLMKLLGAFGQSRIYTRAQGTKLWDSEGQEYLDGYAACGIANLGHNPPRLMHEVQVMLTDDAPSRVYGIDVHAAELATELAR